MKKSLLALALAVAITDFAAYAAVTATKKAATATDKAPNYTAEQTADLVKRYAAGAGESVEALATAFGKTTRSIVAKLSREGVYVKKEYTAKDGSAPTSKDEIVQKIAAIIGCSEDQLNGLEKATKTCLNTLLGAFTFASDVLTAESDDTDADGVDFDDETGTGAEFTAEAAQ